MTGNATTVTSPLITRAAQIKQAEELLQALPETVGLAKSLFWGRFLADWVMPYPQLTSAQRAEVDQALAQLKDFCDRQLDPATIDRMADIPRHVIDGLAQLGVLGMTAPQSFGGRGFSQLAYGQVMAELGARCSSTSIFVNAHHSIGMRALLLFGTDQQKQQWLPQLVRGEKLAAFALTEPEAGSDAANVQTKATPTDDGRYYLLNGEKRYITNGAIADVLTVMARTPSSHGTEVTAFLVTPDMPGFRVVEPRMEKLGIRGTATARLAFENMPVPSTNILGPPGKGLKVALTVLDFGRTTFGACCTGAAKTCLKLAIQHASTRRQFGRTLGEFELVQKKIARMAAWSYAMEAMTTVTASLIDRGFEDYMLETAILKVYSSQRLWTIVNDAFQIHGGAAYFTDRPLERMLRDARINQIGEGANEVLISFIALVGLRGPGRWLEQLRDALRRPLFGLAAACRMAAEQAQAWMRPGRVPVRSPQLAPHARTLGRLIRRFSIACWRTLLGYREEVVERQLEQERIAWCAMELYAIACALSRRDAELADEIAEDPNPALRGEAADVLLTSSARDIRRLLAATGDPDDQRIIAAARAALGT